MKCEKSVSFLSLPIELVIHEIFPYYKFIISEKTTEFFGCGYFRDDETRRIYWLWKSIVIQNWFLGRNKILVPKSIIKTKEIENLEINQELILVGHNFTPLNENSFVNVKRLRIGCEENFAFSADALMVFFSFMNLEHVVFLNQVITGEGWKKENIRKLKKVEMERSFVNLNYQNFRKNEIFAIHCKYYQFNLIDESLRKDRSFVLRAIKQNGLFLKNIQQSFKRDKEIVLEAVKQNGDSLEFAGEFKKNKEVVLEAVKQNVFCFVFADNTLKEDEEICYEILKNGLKEN